MYHSLRPILKVMDKYETSEDHVNDKSDLLLQINIEDASSRKSSIESCVSSNIDHDLLEVTIVPSVLSQITSSNDTITSLMKTLNTISEKKSKQSRHVPSDENKKENKITYRNSKELSTYQKSNHDNPHRSFKSDKQFVSILRKNEDEVHDRANEKISKENTCTQICGKINNTSCAPFIELGAVYKILDFITDSDSIVSSLINNCCNEISRTLQRLLAQCHDKKLEDLLLNDTSLYRCERCGVISYMLQSHPAVEEIKGNRTGARYDAQVMTAERINSDRNNGKSDILIRDCPNLGNNIRSRIYSSKVDQTKYKDEANGTESLPTKEHAFVMRSCIEGPNEANNISGMDVDIDAKIKSHLNNNAIKRLFTDLETVKRDKKYVYNSAARNNHLDKCELSIAMKAYTDIDKEEIVRKISYEPKSQIDDLLAGDWRSKTTRKVQGLQRLVDKHDDIYPVVDTMKYLALGQFTMLDKEEDKLLSKLQESRCTRLEKATNGQSSVLYGSRDDYPQCDSGFWLFDESGQLPEIMDRYHYLPMSKIDNEENACSPANISRRFNMKGKTKKSDNWSDYMEKDSLEDCTLLGQKSNTTTFSSSSAENLIHEWMGSLDGKDEINGTDEDLSGGRRLVSSRPSLDIARHVRAQIAEDRRCDDAKRSMRELRPHDSDIFFRLSPETRRRICHLIKKMILSNSVKDPTFYRDKHLATDVSNSEKLLHSKSTFVHSDKYFKVNNDITNLCADDCIPTRLSELPADKDHLFRRQDNFVNTCNQDLNESKDSIKIPLENTTTSVSFDKSANDSTRKIARRIIYKDVSLKNIVGNDDGHAMTEILSIYRKILDNSKDMDWDKFRELVEILHPGQKELWRDICRTISEETKKVVGDMDGNTEVCIEISPVNPEEALKTSKVITCAREIVFELDMTLKDVESFLDKRPHLVEERLDTHKMPTKMFRV